MEKAIEKTVDLSFHSVKLYY